MKTIKLLVTAMTLMTVQFAKAQNTYGEIRGLITDDEFSPVIAAVVKITQGGILIGGTTTDLNGKYVYKPLNSGQYEVTVMDMQHSTIQFTKINVDPNEATYVDAKMITNSLPGATITAVFKKPVIDKSMFTGESMNYEDILTMASGDRGNIANLITAMVSDVMDDSKGQLHFRGGRAGAESYFIDGVKSITPSGVPGLGIENLTVITGGVPAMYGDLTSGTVIITTRDYFSGIRAKNMRLRDYEERQELKKQERMQKENEKNRLKEIEEEKAKDKMNVK